MHGRFLIGVTGPPGSGKTTAVELAAEILRKEGRAVAGILTREVRLAGKRIGFDIIDIETSQAAPLARESAELGPRVGRYRVYVENLDGYAVGLVSRAIESGAVVIVDEVGPMELMSPRFRDILRRVLSEAREGILTLHFFSRDPLVVEIRSAVDKLITLRRGDARRAADEVARLLLRGER
ncbi:MAG: nucleoside-triphosphatase [Nitrososphaerota archaeon]|nr:AAA family ATPase [Candidatus Calditenuaceae archaeon]MDW8073228.1 nucleoside-triphosphatase [Nitrososphaerota archaeon]